MLKTRMGMIGILAIGISSTAMLANAGSLTIINETNHDATSIINRGTCSSTFPGGVTPAHSTNVVPEKLLRTVCGNKTCKADIYMEDHCKGPIIAQAEFNVKTGLGNISAPVNGYVFQTRDPFTIVITGGPAFTNK